MPFVSDASYGKMGHLRNHSFNMMSKALFDGRVPVFAAYWWPEPARIGRLFSAGKLIYVQNT